MGLKHLLLSVLPIVIVITSYLRQPHIHLKKCLILKRNQLLLHSRLFFHFFVTKYKLFRQKIRLPVISGRVITSTKKHLRTILAYYLHYTGRGESFLINLTKLTFLLCKQNCGYKKYVYKF